MTPHGIPTIYNGVQYRSRLEARWAAFFDLLGWKYQYEPFELPGWIPDFLLLGAWPTLVEVKPVLEFPEDIALEIEDACLPDHELLIVGCTIPIGERPSLNNFWIDRGPFGWLGEEMEEGSVCWGDACFGRWRAGGGRFGFCHSEQSFTDRISGGYDGGCHGDIHFEWKEVLDLWNRAGNLTQWRGKQSVTT